MTAFRVFILRLANLVRRRRRDRQLGEEIQAHLDCLADEFVRQGMSRKNADAAARRAFGGVEQVKEVYRDQRGLTVVETFWQDLRHAFRLLRKEPGTTAVAVITLALGISVSNASFTIVNATCIRGLPIDRPERVMFLETTTAQSQSAGISYLDFEDVRHAGRSFHGLAAYTVAPMTVSEEGAAPERIVGTYISAGGFRLLGETPVLGREFLPGDDHPGAPRVSILGGAVWRSRYSADPAILGRTIIVNGTPSTVIGVMDDRFRFPGNANLWQPLASMPDLADQRRDARALSVFGRLRDDVTMMEAQTELDAVSSALARQYAPTNQGVRIHGGPINDAFNGRITDTVWVAFLTAGTLVLLVACANLANLLLMRAAGRSREMAVRSSIGATRLRIMRQLLVESALLAALGGLVGLGLSVAAVHLLATSVPADAPLPYWIEFTLDVRVFSFLSVVCLGSVVLFGLVPALHLSRTNTNDALRAGARSGAGGVRTRRWTSAFLVIEFALSLVLLANVGLTVRQFRTAQRADAPIDTGPLLTAWLTLPDQKYRSPEERWLFYTQVNERLMAAPSISAATVATSLPFGGAMSRQLVIAGREPTAGEAPPTVQTVTIGTGYFETLGLQMLRGRAFGSRDGMPGQETAIVNQRFVDMYFPDDEVIGQRIQVRSPNAAPAASPWVTVVGVSPTVRQRPTPMPDPVVYLPDRGAPPISALLIVRAASGEPADIASTVREEVRRLDPHLPLSRVMSMEQSMRESNWAGRVSAVMLYTISGIAFLLSLVGLYAVTAHAVTHRTQEIGVRIALGARPRQVMWDVLRRALTQLATGLAFGVGCAFVFQHLFTDPTSPERLTDPATLIPLLALITLVAGAACASPAMRAANLDPVRALRHE